MSDSGGAVAVVFTDHVGRVFDCKSLGDGLMVAW